MEKNSLLFGLVLGCITPVIGFVVIEFIFNMMTQYGLMAEVSSSTSGRRFRTLTLIAVCSSLIPFNMAKNRRWDNTMRGIIFPTLIYVGAWIFKFYGELFG